jgi:hypothetical protein
MNSGVPRSQFECFIDEHLERQTLQPFGLDAERSRLLNALDNAIINCENTAITLVGGKNGGKSMVQTSSKFHLSTNPFSSESTQLISSVFDVLRERKRSFSVCTVDGRAFAWKQHQLMANIVRQMRRDNSLFPTRFRPFSEDLAAVYDILRERKRLKVTTVFVVDDVDLFTTVASTQKGM